MHKFLKSCLCFLLIILSVIPNVPASFAAEDPETEAAVRHMEEWGFYHKEGVVLVLSGGGTKGLSHVGVLEVLEREQIPIAAIVGTSMGSIIGGIYACGYTSAEMREILEKSDLMEIISGRSGRGPFGDTGFNHPRPSGVDPVTFYMDETGTKQGRTGLLRAKDLYAFLSSLTSRVSVADFDELPIPFAAIATNLLNGDTVLLRDGNLASALRASMSIPIVFEPWEMDDMLLVDGGLKANLPVIEAKKMFPGHPVLAINLSPEDITRPRGTLNSITEISGQTLEILMVEQVRQNVAAADLVISPHVSDFGVLDSGGYDEIIQRGVSAAQAKVDELHALLNNYRSVNHAIPKPTEFQRGELIVAEIRVEGVPDGIAEELYEKFEDWIGQPLDMQKVAKAVEVLSAREEFLSVEAKTHNISRDKTAVTFSIERPPKYEVGVNGYASNIHPDRWFSLSVSARDTFLDGDSTSFEYRFSEHWGAMLRYFSPLDEREQQFGLLLSARKEDMTPRNSSAFDIERYTARAAWYKSFSTKLRLGLGYMTERATYGDKNWENGPYISLNFNNLDDPIMPTRGLAIATDLWYPFGETLASRTKFELHLPIWESRKVIFSGGLKTGDGDDPAYAALLGNHNELYSLAKKPLMGDQAYWLHFGADITILKSWWGGVNAELFGTFGQVMRDWTNDGSWWEVGLGFSIPTNYLSGKLVVVYDQDGEFTFGYSIGLPIFWNGAMP